MRCTCVILVCLSSMEGVRPEPRQGFPMDPYGMFPTQRVYVKGEWLRNFQEQLRRRRRDRGRSTEEPSPEVAAAENAHRLCRGKCVVDLLRSNLCPRTDPSFFPTLSVTGLLRCASRFQLSESYAGRPVQTLSECRCDALLPAWTHHQHQAETSESLSGVLRWYLLLS